MFSVLVPSSIGLTILSPYELLVSLLKDVLIESIVLSHLALLSTEDAPARAHLTGGDSLGLILLLHLATLGSHLLLWDRRPALSSLSDLFLHFEIGSSRLDSLVRGRSELQSLLSWHLLSPKGLITLSTRLPNRGCWNHPRVVDYRCPCLCIVFLQLGSHGSLLQLDSPPVLSHKPREQNDPGLLGHKLEARVGL